MINRHGQIGHEQKKYALNYLSLHSLTSVSSYTKSLNNTIDAKGVPIERLLPISLNLF
jgi:hypothetical protein